MVLLNDMIRSEGGTHSGRYTRGGRGGGSGHESHLTLAAVGSMLWKAERASMWKLPGTRLTMMKPDNWHPA